MKSICEVYRKCVKCMGSMRSEWEGCQVYGKYGKCMGSVLEVYGKCVERIRSLREVWEESEVYAKLLELWEVYSKYGMCGVVIKVKSVLCSN